MLGYNHSTTSTPMSDMARNVFIIGKYYFGKSHCSIGTLIKSSYSTHNISSFWVIEQETFSHSYISYYTENSYQCQVKNEVLCDLFNKLIEKNTIYCFSSHIICKSFRHLSSGHITIDIKFFISNG